MEKLKEEKKLLSPGITDKEKIEANTKINCIQQKLDLVNHMLEEFVAIDNKYTENENQRFIQKNAANEYQSDAFFTNAM